MSNLELLYDKLSAEYDKFIAYLLVSSPTAIIDAAYQKTVKEDILSCFEFSDSFSEQEISALLSLENPLDELYLNWRDADDSHMDELRESIDSFAKHEADRQNPVVDSIAAEQSTAQIDSEPENPQKSPTVNGNSIEQHTMLYPEKQAALMACIDSNIREYHSALMDFGKRELIDMAEKISAMSNAYSYMREYDFADDELDFLLHFQNPLEVVADAACDNRGAMTDDIGFALDHVFTHKQDFIVNYPLTRDADISADAGIRRFMGVDLIGFLGKIADRVITDLTNDWYMDSDTLRITAEKSDFDNGRFIWAVCPFGTLLNYEKDVFIKGSDAYKAMIDSPRRENDMLGYYVEVTKDNGWHVIGNVYEVGNYVDFVKHIRDTALPADSVILSYSGEWGANAGKTITVSTGEFDRDRYRLMNDSGYVTSVCYNPTDGQDKLMEVLRAEHSHRMSYPIGSIEGFHKKLSETLNAAENPPEQAKSADTATKKQSIMARLEEAGAQARAYNAQYTDNSKQHQNRTDKEII